MTKAKPSDRGRQLNVLIGDTELSDLQAIRERDGIPVAEQVRRAIAAWLETKREPARRGSRS